MAEEVLITGKSSFKIEVPYKLVENGGESPKPLIVYLHGFRQNIESFQQKMSKLTTLNAYHLFIQGPYPIIERSGGRKVEEWGRAWYLYDGDQSQFMRSLELSSEFIQEIVDGVLNHIEVNRIAVVGYSMGAYLAGYFALTRWKHVNELVMIGGRLKTELFEDREHHFNHINALALHGKDDKVVKAEHQEKCMEQFSKWGANVISKKVQAGHQLDSAYLNETFTWFLSLGYKKS